LLPTTIIALSSSRSSEKFGFALKSVEFYRASKRTGQFSLNDIAAVVKMNSLYDLMIQTHTQRDSAALTLPAARECMNGTILSLKRPQIPLEHKNGNHLTSRDTCASQFIDFNL
jgi:hypothetical protein